ncbi:MAG TPA: O-antigen ligase family protein [Gaiellaceae bacterium]|nr:O-antigen ligase family protein [Gaiellaceae bacterium]
MCRTVDRPTNSRPDQTGPGEARLGLLTTALIAGSVVGLLGLADGGYSAPGWGWATLALVAVTPVILVAFGLPRASRLELGFLGGLAALTAWGLLSTMWSDDRAQSILDPQRSALYVAAAAAVLLAGRRAAVPWLLGGLLLAITLVCAYGLSLRLFPDSLASGGVPLSTDPEAAFRLAQPLGYSNALAALAAIGLALSLFLAARSEGAVAALAAAPSPLLAATIYLTFGRGAWLALAAGLVVALTISRERLRLLTALLVLGGAPAVAVVVASQLDALTSRPASVDDVSDDGRVLALALALLVLGAAAVAFGFSSATARLRPSGRALRAYKVALVVVAAVGVAGAVLAAGGPADVVSRFYHGFNAPPAPREGDVGRRVLSFSGSSRSDYWQVTWNDVEDNPLLGSGAGTFQRRWLRHRPADLPVRDAHSLYLETLAELGPVGLLLLLAALACPLAAAVRARDQPLVPAAAGAYGCFLVHAGIDWDWEVPAVTLAGLSAGAALLLAARRDEGRRTVVGRTLAAAVAGAFVFSVVIGIALLGNLALDRSAKALDRGDSAAAKREARRAGRWAPWSPESWRLLGEAQLAEGDLDSASRSFRKGLAKDDRSWELWLDLALASDGAERRRALDKAETLNPRAREIQELREGG